LNLAKIYHSELIFTPHKCSAIKGWRSIAVKAEAWGKCLTVKVGFGHLNIWLQLGWLLRILDAVEAAAAG